MNTTDEGFSFSFHKNYKLGPTYPRHAIFSLRELHDEPVCFEGWNKFSVPIWPLWEPNLTHRRSRCQLDLLSVNFDFRYFPSSGRSTNERSLQALLSSAPRGFAARSRVLARPASLAQMGELPRRLVSVFPCNKNTLTHFKSKDLYHKTKWDKTEL